MNSLGKIKEEISNRCEYWTMKEHNSHSCESEIRMSECMRFLLLLNNAEREESENNKKLIEKACEWLRNNSHYYADNALGKEYLVNDFKNYMKGE